MITLSKRHWTLNSTAPFVPYIWKQKDGWVHIAEKVSHLFPMYSNTLEGRRRIVLVPSDEFRLCRFQENRETDPVLSCRSDNSSLERNSSFVLLWNLILIVVLK